MRGVNFFALLLLLIFPLAMIGPMLLGARRDAARSSSVNNLKQLLLAMHSHNDAIGYLPCNGGTTDPDQLKEINFGWHNPNVRFSGTWVTQILPWIEQDPFFGNVQIKASSVTEVPAWLADKKNANNWQVTVKTLVCPGRGRVGFKSDTAAGCFPGPVTDYAINVFINSMPENFGNNDSGFAIDGGVPIAMQSKMTIQGIMDGSSNTLLLAGKALPREVMASNKADRWDEGIFSPGNYKADNEKSTLTSTGTGRGHVVNPNVKHEDAKERPAGGGVPWIWRDRELVADPEKNTPIPDYSMDWGTPFPVLLVGFGDGSVRSISMKYRGTINFARMLYPNDGRNVVLDD